MSTKAKLFAAMEAFFFLLAVVYFIRFAFFDYEVGDVAIGALILIWALTSLKEVLATVLGKK